MKKIYIITVSVITISIAFFAYNFFTHQKTEVSEAALSRNGLTLDLNFGNNNGSATPTVYDSSGFNRNAVAQNAQTCNNSFCDFDGSTDYMTLTGTNVYNTPEVSIAIKFAPDFILGDGTNRFLYDADTPINAYLAYIVGSTGNLVFYLGGTGMTQITKATILPYWKVGEENVLIIVGNATTDRTDAYLNGNKIKNQDTTAWTASNPATISIGARANGADRFNGKIHYLKVWNRLLTDNEVANLSADRKTTAQTPSRTGLVGHWNMDSNDINGTTVLDRSGNNKNGTISSTPTTATGKIGQSLNFNGSSQVLSIDDSTLYNFTATTPFTISAWVKPTATITTFSHIAGRMAGSINRYSIHIDSSSRFSSLVGGTTGGGYTVSTNIPPVGEWTLLTMTYDGSSNLNGVTNYLNGVSVKVGSSSVISGELYSEAFTIGRDTTTAYPFNGSIDDVRIYNYALSAQEVSELYNSAKSSHTQAPSRTGLVGYWNMDANDINGTTVLDKSGQNNNGTIVGGVTLTTGKIGEAINNNNIRYLDTGSIVGDFVEGSQYTISQWINITSYDDLDGIFSKDQTSSYEFFLRFQSNGDLAFSTDASVNALDTNYAPSFGVWHLITAVYDSSVGRKIYADGVLVAQDANTTPSPPDNDSLYFGSDFNSFRVINGKMDDVRIYNYALSAGEVAGLYNATRKIYIK